MHEGHEAGYLTQTEANRIGVRPGPNVIYLRLIRDFASEGRPVAMFSELTPGHAMRLIRELQAAVGVAISRETSPDLAVS